MSRFVLSQIVRIRQFAHHVLPQSMRRRDTGAMFAMLVIIGFVVTLQQVHALDFTVDGLIRGASYMLFAIANLFIALTLFCLRFFITLASYNNYIDVPIVKLGWAMVRDVANMFFVVALLVIAFATILGYEQYEWKRGMVKLVLMAIFINFSNLIAQLIIDVAHVFTMTFLNAISATAGGNLINMFNMDKVMSMATGVKAWESVEGAAVTIFATAVFAVFYSVMALVSIGSYAIVMMIRVVVLWTLIILSPLAYVLYAMPKGEKYAQEWWSEFSKHVIVAPIMVFFLWLSFATLGAGNVLSDIENSVPASHKLQTGQVEVSIALSKVSTWEKLANFLIAFAFLMIGLQKTKESGVQGAGMVGSATNLGKKVAMGVTGITAARFLGRKGLEKGKEFGIKKGKNLLMPIAGRASKQFEKFQRLRNRGASTLDKQAAISLADRKKKEGWAGVGKGLAAKTLGSLTSMVIQSSGRADKKAEDWSKGIEADRKRTKEGYSTSSTPSGQYKLEAQVKLEQDEKRGAAKKERKKLEMANKLADSAKGYKSRSDAAKFFTVLGGRADDAQFIKSIESQVDTETAVTDLKQQDRLFMAQKKADALTKKGKFTAAEAVLRDAQVANVEELDKVIKGINYKEYGSTARRIVKRATDALAAIAANSALSAPEKASERKRVEETRTRELTSLLSAAGKQGDETWSDTFAAAYKESGFTDEIDDTNRMAALAAVMSGKNGSATGGTLSAAPADIRSDMDKVKNSYGSEDEYNIVMRNMRDAIGAAAKDGAVAWAGVVDGKLDERTYDMKYDFGGGNVEIAGAVVDDRHQQVDSKAYFAKRLDLRKIERANGFCDMNVDGEITDISRSGEALLAAIFQKMNANQVSQIKASFWDGLKSAGNIVAVQGRLAGVPGMNVDVMTKINEALS